MRMTARVEEIERGVFEAAYTLEPGASVPTTERVEHFQSEAAACQWIRDTAKLQGLPPAAIWREGSAPLGSADE